MARDLRKCKVSKTFLQSRTSLAWSFGNVLLDCINGDEMTPEKFQQLNLNMQNPQELKKIFETNLKKAPNDVKQAIGHWILLKNQGCWCTNEYTQ